MLCSRTCVCMYVCMYVCVCVCVCVCACWCLKNLFFAITHILYDVIAVQQIMCVARIQLILNPNR
jgi:hypothetical protein